MMEPKELAENIKERGRQFFDSIGDEAPSVFQKGWWSDKVMDWAMRNESFKVRLFRFIDVLPSLSTNESLTRHLEEYFACDEDVPAVLKWGIKPEGGGGLAATFIAKAIRHNITGLATQFIIGKNTKEALKSIRKLRKDNFAFTIDILGEASVSEEEEAHYQEGYLQLLDALAQEKDDWKDLGGAALDWGSAPRINIAIKPTTLCSQADPRDFAGTVAAVVARLTPIIEKAMKIGAFVCIDMEQFHFKDITIAVFRQLRSDVTFRDYPYLGIALQSYLRQTDKDLADLLMWAKEENLPISIRLVKGAYWDYETVVARQNGWEIPVYTCKAETDAAYERHARRILEHHEICHLACGSHNVRTIAAVMEMALALNVPEDQYEFQVLYGMAEPVRKGLQKIAGRVRLYCPYGELLPGMAYLVRRLLENTSNESFLRQSFVEKEEVDRLLEDPVILQEETCRKQKPRKTFPVRTDSENVHAFINEPFADFTRQETRNGLSGAIIEVRKKLGRTYPLLINNKEVITEKTLASVNPAASDEIIGHVCQAGQGEIDLAIDAAKEALSSWRDTVVKDRVDILFEAASIMRRRMYALSALQVLEVGKQWDQAQGDVAEAIDFLEYYGREMLRLGKWQSMGRQPGELNHYFYQPRGIAAVIAPWNFPLAISCGMCSAAIVAGNTVLYKPAGLSSVVGVGLVKIFIEAGLPPGVLNFVPGPGSKIGDYIVDHRDIGLIAFTGSQDVGLRIAARAAKVHPGQFHVKKVIAEMGGKNAIIVDDDADLDEAVAHIIKSAFGYQGQKCSACSRVIVLDPVYEKLVHRLVEAARSVKIGPAEDPANFMGPVVDGAACKKIMEYIEIGKEEGNLLLQTDVPGGGFYAPITIVDGITPDDRLAQEEVFGPVLSVMRASSFEEAVDIANNCAYALTGGVFSRSPVHLLYARENFRVGNLYLNRGTTGALVLRQPFGGFKMSGIGSKAGGPDYMLQFMEPRTITENTMRRGFVPEVEEDDFCEAVALEDE